MSTVTRAQQKSLLGLVLVAVMVALLWWVEGPGQGSAGQQQDRGTSSQTGSQTGSRADELPTIDAGQLPDEAHETIALIELDGPFPHDEDGATFENRERLLPIHPMGYYREYTVETPGEDDRGARRIVTGGDTMYWTDDHYRSFARIVGRD